MSDQPQTAKAETQGLIRRTIEPRAFSLLPTTFGEAREMAAMIANSEFAPKDYKGKPENVIIAIQMGADLGLRPMQALQSIAVINGRPSVYGDAALALCMPALERFKEGYEGEPGKDDYTAVCTVHRKGWPDETVQKFSIADAKKAGLWGKQGPWTNYPMRMLMWRARSWALRDSCSDLLLGLMLAEEAADYPQPSNGPNVVQGEVVTSQTVNPLDRVPEEFREQVSKGFETCKLGAGVQLAKINEFLGGEGVDPQAGAAALVEWLKDEYAKRKSGKPRQKKKDGDNGKTQSAQTAQGDGGDTQQQSTGSAPAVDAGSTPTAAAKPAETQSASGAVKARDGEIF